MGATVEGGYGYKIYECIKQNNNRLHADLNDQIIALYIMINKANIWLLM